MRLATARTVLASKPCRGKRLPCSSKYPDQLLDPASHIFNWYRDFSRVVKQSECEFGHLTPYRADVKIVWNNTSGRLMCLQGVERKDFTFLYLIHMCVIQNLRLDQLIICVSYRSIQFFLSNV